MKTSDVLMAAQAVISEPERWTHTFFARSAFDHSISADAPGAVCWCAAGAINAVAAHSSVGKAFNIVDGIAISRGFNGIAVLNDDPSTDHQEIMGIFTTAIEIAKQQENA